MRKRLLVALVGTLAAATILSGCMTPRDSMEPEESVEPTSDPSVKETTNTTCIVLPEGSNATIREDDERRVSLAPDWSAKAATTGVDGGGTVLYEDCP